MAATSVAVNYICVPEAFFLIQLIFSPTFYQELSVQLLNNCCA